LRESIVTPTAEGRQHPLDFITAGKAAAKERPHARGSLLVRQCPGRRIETREVMEGED